MAAQPRARGFLAMGLVACLMLACVCLPKPRYTYSVVTTTPPGPVTRKPDGKLGDKVTRGGFSITVTQVEEAREYGSLEAEAGKKLLAVELVIEGASQKGVDANDLYARVQDSDGGIYFLTFGGKEPSFDPRYDLRKGMQVRGWVTYEVPEGAHGFLLIYEPVALGKTVNAVIDLGR